ncbi:MAG: glycosyltransferase family 2 protein [Pseudomonadota bacterium]|nr:glycosyltransferase family 2 protein [Pseudomonadota bacterium]
MSGNATQRYRIAVLVPCFNEAVTIAKVVQNFAQALPDAEIYVYDNNSSDDTVSVASAAGAIVRRERTQGKGSVVRRMFSDVEADVYVLVDGDDTYDAGRAPELIQYLLEEQMDMINASRRSTSESVYRRGHAFGNKLITGLVSTLFGNRFQDMLSGYRVFSRRFVKSFPALSSGFEIETELTVHALELQMPVLEIEVPYYERPENSESKLNTFRDGARIIRTIGLLLKQERPFQVFAGISIVLTLLSILAGWPVVNEYIETGLVPRLPTAVLSSALMILGFLSLACGLILDTVTRGRREFKRLHYLTFPAVSAASKQKANKTLIDMEQTNSNDAWRNLD